MRAPIPSSRNCGRWNKYSSVLVEGVRQSELLDKESLPGVQSVQLWGRQELFRKRL